MYPLKFDPIYQYRIWGGRRLANFLSKPLPKDEPIGEAWILSDRENYESVVLNGTLKGQTLTQLLMEFPEEIMGNGFEAGNRFPLLLKFLDCAEVLSVQVHPSDSQHQFLPAGNTGKTEAWVVLEADKNSCIYAGLKKGTTKEDLIKSIKNKSVSDQLHSFIPRKGDAVFIRSGTVHSLNGAVVFEVQENSDVTFRLYDWDRKDLKTGKPRDLQLEKAIACIDFNQVDIGPVTPVNEQKLKNKEKLFDNQHFKLWQIKSSLEFKVGFKVKPAILICIEGKGTIKFNHKKYAICKGEVFLLPAIIEKLKLQPEKEITIFQIGIPEQMIETTYEKANNI